MRPEPGFVRSPLGGWQSSIKPMSPAELELYRRDAFRVGVFDINLADTRLTEGERRTLVGIGQRIWGK